MAVAITQFEIINVPKAFSHSLALKRTVRLEKVRAPQSHWSHINMECAAIVNANVELT